MLSGVELLHPTHFTATVLPESAEGGKSLFTRLDRQTKAGVYKTITSEVKLNFYTNEERSRVTLAHPQVGHSSATVASMVLPWSWIQTF